MKIIAKTVRIIDKIIESISMVLLVLTIVVTAYQVVMRFVFNNPTSWSEEVTLLLLIWFGYIGVAMGVGRNYHITIESVTQRFPQKIQDYLQKFSDILICIFGGLMVQKGLELMKIAKVQVLPATQLNKSIMYLSLVVSGMLLVMYTVARLLGLELELEKHSERRE